MEIAQVPCFTVNDSIVYLITDIGKRYVTTNYIKLYSSTNFGNNWNVDSSISFLQSSPANEIISEPTNPNGIYIITGVIGYGYSGCLEINQWWK